MTLEEIKKQRVNLAKLGYKPAVAFDCHKAISYGMNGLGAVKHNYMTPNDALKSLWDVYHKGEYVATFNTEKAAMAFMERRDKELGGFHLTDLVREVTDLNLKMHEDIVQFLKKHNGFVRTDNAERVVKNMQPCNPIYVISMNADDEPNTEKKVLAVALFGEDQVAVLPDLSDNETILGMTDQQVLDCDNWEWIFGGYVLQNATLCSICECIEQYV